MDSKIMLIAAAAAVILIAGAVYLVTGGEDPDDPEPVTGSIDADFKFDNKAVRVAIGGNANGDDYIDEKDIDTLKKLIEGDIGLDPVMNGYADANNDGVIDAQDIAVVEKIIAGEPTTIYYWSAAQSMEPLDFPLKGKVATAHMYSIDVMIILGLYDMVKGTAHITFENSIAVDGVRYPGMGTSIKDIGQPEENCEEAVKQGINVFLTQSSKADYSTWKKVADSAGLDLQIVRLKVSGYNVKMVEMRGSVLMYGIMFQATDRAHEFVDWVDGVRDYIDRTTGNANRGMTFITPMSASDANDIQLDTIDPLGNMMGDVYTLSLTGMRSVNTVANGCPAISLEEVYRLDPDVIVVIMFHTAEASVEKVQQDLDRNAELYKNTRAYRNGDIYGVNYYNIASTPGASELVLLSSYIWDDKFDQDVGWEYLQHYYDHFTMYKDADLRSMGNAVPFQMQAHP